METALEAQAADDVEAVELDQPPAHIGQIPTGRRRRSTHPALRIQGTPPLEDPGDGADGRDRTAAFDHGLELAADCRRSVLAEDALLAEDPPDVEDPILEFGRRPADPPWDRRSIRPIDPLERLVNGSP